MLASHRAVYAALAPLMGSAIHALSLATHTPDEMAGHR
jgi:stress-induced morphogen